jgi:hypothetical protein
MTPKLKAEKLVDTYRIILMDEDTDCGNEVLCTLIAKKFALIAVDEILNSNPCCEDSDRGGNFQWASNEYYWQEVKQEIEKYIETEIQNI